MLLAGLTEGNSFQNKRVCVTAGENSSGGLSDQEVNVLLSAAKKTLIFLNAQFSQIQGFSSRLRPCGYHIYTSLGWEVSMYPEPAQGKAQIFLSLDQRFLALISRQGERESRTQALLGRCQGFTKGRTGPGVKGDFFMGQPCQKSTGFTQLKADKQ